MPRNDGIIRCAHRRLRGIFLLLALMPLLFGVVPCGAGAGESAPALESVVVEDGAGENSAAGAAVRDDGTAGEPNRENASSSTTAVPMPPADAATPSQAETDEARLAEEHKKKREEERKSQLAEAEQFIETADKTLMETLPYPLNLLLGVSFFGITLWRYLAAGGLILLAILLIWALSRRFRKMEKVLREPEGVGRWQLAGTVLVLALRHASRIILFALLLRVVSSLLVTSYHPDIVWLARILLYTGFLVYFYDLISLIDLVYGGLIFQGDNRLTSTVRPIVVKGIQGFIIVVAGMYIYHDLTGKTMFSVLAGLGIGGLALALASQETLRNLLGFASIALDKSFMVGDWVNIEGYHGIIERVGLRCMRLRAFDGSAVIIPNNTAITSTLVNFGRRPYARREIRIALSAKNPYEKVEEAMELIREALNTHDGKVAGLPPVVRFAEFEPGRFVIQCLFWYDAKKPFYFDECSHVNMEVAKRLSDAGIRYAEWPVQ